MKKFILLFAMAFILCTAFNKPMLLLLTDYRDAYVGKYFCHINCSGVNSGGNGISYKKDTATITVSKDVLDSILNIRISKTTLKVKLKSGIMYPYPDGRWRGKFFAADSIKFSTILASSPSTCGYRGKKN